MTNDKMKKPVNAADFGVPPEWLERAENYANFVRWVEREACAKVCIDETMGCEQLAYSLAAAIRARK